MNNVGNEVLATVVQLLKDMPPQSLAMSKTLSALSKSCIVKGKEFIEWAMSPHSCIDKEGKRMALEILFLFALHEGETFYMYTINWSCMSCTVMIFTVIYYD